MGGGVLGEIVDDDQRMLAAIAKIFRHGEAGERRDPLQSGRARRARHDDDAALGRALGLDRLDGAPHARRLLAHGDVDADDVAALLVDDGVDGDRSLADGAVADDEFALAAPEREQGVHHDQAGLHRLGHQIAVDDLRRRPFDRLARIGGDRSLAVERTAKRVDDASEQGGPDRDPHDVAHAAHRVAGFDRIGVVQQNAADALGLQHLGEAELALVEAHKFVEPRIRQSGHERDAVADLLDAPDLFGAGAELGGVQPGARLFEPEVGPVDWAGGVSGAAVRIGCHGRCPRGFG